MHHHPALPHTTRTHQNEMATRYCLSTSTLRNRAPSRNLLFDDFRHTTIHPHTLIASFFRADVVRVRTFSQTPLHPAFFPVSISISPLCIPNRFLCRTRYPQRSPQTADHTVSETCSHASSPRTLIRLFLHLRGGFLTSTPSKIAHKHATPTPTRRSLGSK